MRMMNIFEALRKDHKVQRKLINELLETSGETEERKRLFYMLKNELKIHADAEERFFYIPLFEDESTQEKARHGVAEHHEMDELLEKLERTSFDSSTWLPTLKNLKEKIEHHLEEEEHVFFQLAGKLISENQKSSFAKRYNKYIKDKRALEIT